ncbi:HAD family phosphatase [Chroococcus sp. FPU101]|uniref:HAD family hydrolase n=1 Tax=Chroococcus sp. FPU101 TaxID=1974212 RepID=UPI001A8C834E|nr:HAD family phosphatase [Chroococcus sp. FPU101]GFE67897.1 HAD-superfamily hydrolase, subfamily IA, variant 3 [Chroococcus sp. FPU101]
MLKVVLFDFNGVIINDESIHQELIEDILLGENLTPKAYEFQELCLGRSDRTCLRDILARRSRIVSDDYLTKLIQKKSISYLEKLEKLEKLPIYSGLETCLEKVKNKGLRIGLVTGALRSEVDFILQRSVLTRYFEIIVTGEEINNSKPNPEGYLLAVERFNRLDFNLRLQPTECLVIEDSPAGIEAAKRAKMQVVGIANTYPFHFMQRLSNWAIDYLKDLELERIETVFNRSST